MSWLLLLERFVAFVKTHSKFIGGFFTGYTTKSALDKGAELKRKEKTLKKVNQLKKKVSEMSDEELFDLISGNSRK